MARGGKRDGAGRKAGTVSHLGREAHDRAAETGELPHEFLLRVARGEDLFFDVVTVSGRARRTQRKPTFAERIDAAKSAAPFFQPRLATTSVAHSGSVGLLEVAKTVNEETSVAVAKEMLRDAGYEVDD
ncbi:hypothetical protein BTH42_31930 [Burkholderia sp. SRS-W-2-2016]|uniref:hypothetical protein n=1 Tax=Burkholderia sp. SRS-W-2-2016 TaxID=1926878 RepID=UPI00095A7228|nr:hypothetical protein [Burkholderia sp. SRS-W-2-2016]OLL27457.1 hypothetical protein BTH42_31930 [Burkholderia sp. SRS-W-2-2016]